MALVFLLMGIIFNIGPVMATKLFGVDFPEWFGTLSLFPISDYDAGKLIDGDSAAGDGGLSLRVDVLCPLHHGDHIRGCELVGWSDCKFYAGCAFLGGGSKGRQLSR